MKLTAKHIFWLKALAHSLNLAAFIYLASQTLGGRFGADPVEAITDFTGTAALNLLLVTLVVTPVAKWSKQGQLFKCRRLLGLYCFFWASLHMLTFFWLNLGLDFSLFSSEVVKRPYLALGAICWVILLALSLTSTSKIQRMMGANWQRLHNWVYLVLILAPIHFLWSAKSELVEPSVYLALALLLLVARKNKLVSLAKSLRP